MTLNETLAATGSRGADNAHEPFSAAWWEGRTAEELRDIIKRGFAGGQAFQGAVDETERRARAETRRLRDAAAIEAESRKIRKLDIVRWTVAAVVTIAATAGIWLTR